MYNQQKDLSNLPDDLLSFMQVNKIYTLDKLLSFSDQYLASLNRYSTQVSQLIHGLRKNTSDGGTHLIRRKVKTADDMYLSVRLYRIMTREGFYLKPLVFLCLSDNELMALENFGNTCLEEVYRLRRRWLVDAKILGHRISFRLRNVMIREGFNLRLLNFLCSPDKELMAYKNFGQTCLEEVYCLREKLLNENEIRAIDESQIQKKIVGGKIQIPEEIADLDLTYILRFSSRLEGNVFHAFKRLLNRFNRFGEFNNLSFQELINTRGIGKTTFQFFTNWLACFHSDSFRSLANRYSDQQMLIKEIRCTQELLDFFSKMNIDCLKDIEALDHIELSDLTKTQKLVLLELRTLSFDKATGQFTTGAYETHDKSIIEWIDDFIQKTLSPTEKKIILDRWNNESGEITLAEAGELNNLTRERVRQLIKRITDKFELLYVSEENEKILTNFLDIILNNLSPVDFNDLVGRKKISYKYHENLYVCFLSHVFECVPFIKKRYGYTPTKLGYRFVSSEFDYLEHELYEMASQPNLVNLSQFLGEKDIKYQLRYLKAILIRETLTITKHKQDLYVNRTSYGLFRVLRQCIREYDRPVELEEFVEYLSSNPFYLGKSHLHYIKQFGRKGKSSVFAALNRVDSFIRLDRYVWGLEKHMGYPRKQWKKIVKACRNVLRKLDHQASAAYLFESIQDQFPDLRSKYELNYILQRDSYLSYLGFMTFTLESSGQKERLKIKDLVVKLFEDDPNPKSGDDIYTEIEKLRTMPTREGQSTLLRQIEGIKYYKPSYFGLDRFHRENLDYLYTNEPYLKKLLSRIYPHTSVDNIMEELEVRESPQSYLSFLNQCKRIVHWELNQQHFFAAKDSSNFIKAITILAHSSKPMFLDQLILIIKSSLSNIKINKYKLRHELNSDPRVSLLKGGEYKFIDIADHIDKYQPLFDEIEDYILNKGQLVDVSDLHEHIDEFSESEKPSKSEELLMLLELDNRFTVFGDNLIGLL